MALSDASDCDWLGLEQTGPGRWSFELTSGLSRLDGRFYGGTGIAVSTALIEAETGRPARWVTVQYTSSALTGEGLECRVEVVAAGRRSSQVQVSGWRGARMVFFGVGAAGEAPGPSGIAGATPDSGASIESQFGRMPTVPGPAACAGWEFPPGFVTTEERPGWLGITDARVADPGGAMWMRLDDRHLTRSRLAFLADVIPGAVLRSSGVNGGGTSLDNTVRFGAEPRGEWLLVEVQPHMVSAGYVHGAARLWAADGTLLGVASQTASLVLWG